jgi:drug/metabolite transporter (DMT)-like permease
MPKSIFYNSLILLVVSAIWGFSFVAQRAGMEFVGPYTFNGVRFALGTLSLLPLYFSQNKSTSSNQKYKKAKSIKQGILLGLVLFVGASLQQIGMEFTTAANGGFITSLYVVLVPFISVIFGYSINKEVWIGSVLALLGLYLLSFHGAFALSWGDSLVLVSALFWAVHVLLVGRYAYDADAVLLSITQFATTAIMSLLFALVMEEIVWEYIWQAAIPIIYGGVFSVGVAYTLQVFVQKKVAAEQAAIILSFESAFAMLGGWILLNEVVSMRSLAGAGLMLMGIIISQLKWEKIV